MPACGGASWRDYLVKVRVREHHEIEIHGGTKIGGHRRRVTRWSKWTTQRWTDTPQQALDAIEVLRKLNPLSEVACFYGGKRRTEQQLKADAARERAEAEES